MTVRTLLSLALVAAISSLVTGKQCYRCGYMKEGDGPAMALPGMPECGDSANMESNKVDCTAEGEECCGSIREYLQMVDTETGEKRELTIGRHDCEQDLANYAQYNVLCSDHTDACVDIDVNQLPQGHNETIARAKVCFCSGDLCNFHVPDLGKTPSADTREGPASIKCYFCDSIQGECDKAHAGTEIDCAADFGCVINEDKNLFFRGCAVDVKGCREEADTRTCDCQTELCNFDWATAGAEDTTPTADTTTTTTPSEPTTTTTATTPATGCSDRLSFSTGDSFSDGVINCYDQEGAMVPLLSGDTVLSPGTSCVFMSSGHLTSGLVMEMYCSGDMWVVTLVEL